MSNMDLTGEQDPTERLAELDEQSEPTPGADQKEPGHDGSVTTDEIDVTAAVEQLGDDE